MKTCGEFGGIALSTGEPCKRAAGWGTGEHEGLCRTCLEHGIDFEWESFEMPWVRLPGESSRAYDAFRTYRDAGLSRTLVGAYRTFTGRLEAAIPPGYFREWAKNYAWRERAERYDVRMEDELQGKIDSARAQAMETLANAAPMAAAIAVSMAAGRRQLPQLKENQISVGESTQIRGALEVLDRIGVRVPEVIGVDTEGGMVTWVDIMNAVEEADGDSKG